jgi:hypothetical protein
MSVAHGAYVFACGDRHELPEVVPAPRRLVRFEVFGLDGVGEIDGGKTARPLVVPCVYAGYATKTLLYTAIDTDDAHKANSSPANLTIDAETIATNVVFRGVSANQIFQEGATGLWVAARCVLLFEQVIA